MKTPLAVATVLLSTISLAGENGNSLDRKLLGLLLNEAELVVHARMDTGGFVGDAATRARYGLVGPVQIACRMQLEGTVIGPGLEGGTIEFLFSRSPGNERCFIAQGDYLLFLKRDPRGIVVRRSPRDPATGPRWVLVADYLGMQPFTPGLDALVKEIARE